MNKVTKRVAILQLKQTDPHKSALIFVRLLMKSLMLQSELDDEREKVQKKTQEKKQVVNKACRPVHHLEAFRATFGINYDT
jgi:hypothetical protein